ncbi:hypothetical protein L249_7884, partial [Ophiocordyceps polyrhachis-furcata BCC 54312]
RIKGRRGDFLYYSTMTWLYVTPFLQRVDRCDDYLQRADRCDGCLVPRSIGCYDRYRYSAPIAVTIAVTSRSGAITAIALL